jgi:hypothetical protein
MSTVMSSPPQKFVMEDVSWDYYDRTLRERDARGSHLRVTYDEGRMTVLVRTGKGRYEAAERSVAFPDLPMRQFNRFLKMALTHSQHEATRALRDWARGT